MKVVITGLPQAGQQELFSLLTKIPLDTIREHPLDVQQGIKECRRDLLGLPVRNSRKRYRGILFRTDHCGLDVSRKKT